MDISKECEVHDVAILAMDWESGGCHSHRLCSHSCDRTQSTVNSQTTRKCAVNGQQDGQRSNPSAEQTQITAPNLLVGLHMRRALIS